MMNYKISGTPNSPVLILSHSLGTTMEMWDAVVPHLTPYFRVIQYDTRGHGGSEKTDEPYTIALLGNDVLQLMEQLGIEKAHFCGLSMGGLIGQWLAINAPDKISKLIISNSAARVGSEDAWNERIKLVEESGFESFEKASMEKWLSNDAPDSVRVKLSRMFLSNDKKGYSNCCAALGKADFRDSRDKIKCPTLIVTGEDDPVTTVEDANFLAEEIGNSEVKIIPGRHIPAAEFPKVYAETLIHFLVGSEIKEKGMHVRRTVLGDAHVDRASSNINDFNGDFQEFISKYAWGEIWTRPGLPKHTRSLITISMLIALNRPKEFKMHIKAAFHNGVSKEEIKETILQSALYCGLPAANDAFHLAEEVFNDLES
ncbi:bifunctional 3-oxoadipate enol-lactonase/4-carboxymuconolactone decarboxylase PcaDC [Jiulongibacter sp. NS-SX5]|uniref:bifunctional 3-oxoadipate enol-lactonase/4-carboxymuconolactone decarboxylase PcaDC n=1 Tax=Jiulongibacter sp. NS-SX5 TaxID=3463854 RepID=UPI004057DDA2